MNGGTKYFLVELDYIRAHTMAVCRQVLTFYVSIDDAVTQEGKLVSNCCSQEEAGPCTCAFKELTCCRADT